MLYIMRLGNDPKVFGKGAFISFTVFIFFEFRSIEGRQHEGKAVLAT
jgi:hypothetical protein